MTTPSLKNFFRVASSIALLALICAPVHGQWKKVPPGAVPHGADGKPNLSAPAPRLLDGRELGEDFTPSWMGYSTGKWEGDTLVVDTKGFNGRTWLDQAGKPTTDALHVIERFRRKDFGHMDIEITIDDPKAYAKPWTVTEHAQLLPDTELMEFICNENNVDLQHLKGK